MTQRPVPTPQDTIGELLRRSKRVEAYIRRTFVQSRGPKPRPGPLAELVRHHDERGLELFLLISARVSSNKATGEYDVTYHSVVWRRALYLEDGGDASAVSKTLARLVGYRLVRRERAGRQARIIRLREDGSGEPYTHPALTREAFFRLPHAYWAAEWNRRLKLPAKAVLLIALSLRDDFFLPSEQGPAWYGISADTIEAGLRQLRDEGLLWRRRQDKLAPLTPEGYTIESRYTLQAPLRPRQAGSRPPTSASTSPGAANEAV